MRLRGIDRLWRVARRFRNRFAPGALILLYHRVFEAVSDPQLLCVTPQHFAEHLEHLRCHYQIIRLADLARALTEKRLPKGAVVLTFDDGYADNFYNAKPLLERYDIPATVFVTTGYIGQEREFWWDELDRLLLQSGTLPETLRLSANGSTCQWELDEAARYSEDVYRRHRCWNVLEKNDPSARQRLYRSLCQLLRPLPEGERRNVLDELLRWAGAEPMVRPTHRTLSSDEVSHLAVGGLVDAGAHTVTHPVLSALPVAGQRSELQGSKACLEDILGRPITTFSYPYGSRCDYTVQTVAVVREAGFDCACSNLADVVWRGSDRFQLPRVLVRDWDGETFARRLGKWFRG